MKLNAKTPHINPQQLATRAVSWYRGHGATMLFVIAGALIGFSLLRIQALTKLTSTEQLIVEQSGDENAALPKITLDKETAERLRAIQSDQDTQIEPNLPLNRTNPF